jgi:DNA modification methylase
MAWQELASAIHDRQPVSGLTHSFYKYPARFSPSFVRQAILNFTEPGDLVLDPFMGAGTSLVEARVLGRKAIGTDLNTLAVFLAETKTRALSRPQLRQS